MMYLLTTKKTWLLVLFFFTTTFLQAQTVQWASSVLGVSSERRELNPESKSPEPHQFRAKQALGIPNKLPAVGSSKCAWSPSEAKSASPEWIKVGFSNPMQISQVAIAENYNPGAITHIYVYDEADREHLLYRNTNVAPLTVSGRIFHFFVKKTAYKVKSVKVALNTARVPGYNEIDAIAISDSNDPIQAKINLAKKLNVKSKPLNLGTNINSRYDEISPVVAPDGSAIYFTRAKHPQNIGKEHKQDVWYATLRPDNNFDRAKNMGPPINTEHHNSSFSIAPDGNTMLLNNVYRPDGKLVKGLSITRRGADGNWTRPEKVVINGYKNLNKYSEFCLSPNGKVLLMTIQQKDTRGGKDIYVSFLNSDGKTWSKPRNLGSKVNTAESETSPFLAADGVTLYYSTAGFSGFGSNDIFVTRRLDDSWTNWSTPKNLGPEINTDKWDAYFSIPAKADFAYYITYHRSLAGSGDIFRVSLSESNKPKPVALVKGRVFNAKTKQPISAEIAYEILATGKNVGKGHSNPKTGEYKVVLPLEQEYALLAEAKGFLSVDTTINLKGITKYTEIVADLYLVPIESGGVVRLNNIFFNRGSARLLPESYPELNRLAKAMKENPTMRIRLEGHTEIFGNKKFLMNLSKSRVKSVRKYLADNGIEERRVKVKGFGYKRPLSRKTDEKSRALNRRVEVRILSK